MGSGRNSGTSNRDLEIHEELDNESVPEQEPIYVMTIELEKDRHDTVKIFANSEPDRLAFDFCKNNDLDHEAMNYLKEEIKKLMANYVLKTARENDMIKEMAEQEECESDRVVDRNNNMDHTDEGNHIDENEEDNEGNQERSRNNIDDEMITEEGDINENRTQKETNKFYNYQDNSDEPNEDNQNEDNQQEPNQDTHTQQTLTQQSSASKSHKSHTEEYYNKKNILNKAEESLFREKSNNQKLFSYELFDDLTLSKSNINSNANFNKSNFLNSTSNFNPVKTVESMNPGSKSNRSKWDNKEKGKIFDKLYQDAENRRKKAKNNNKDFYLEIQHYNDQNKSNFINLLLS